MVNAKHWHGAKHQNEATSLISCSGFKQCNRKQLFWQLEDFSDIVISRAVFEKSHLLSLVWHTANRTNQCHSGDDPPREGAPYYSVGLGNDHCEHCHQLQRKLCHPADDIRIAVCLLNLEFVPWKHSNKRQFLLCRTLSSEASTYSNSKPNQYFHRPGDLRLSEERGFLMHNPYQDVDIWRCILSRSRMILCAIIYFKGAFFPLQTLLGYESVFERLWTFVAPRLLSKKHQRNWGKSWLCNLAAFFFFSSPL